MVKGFVDSRYNRQTLVPLFGHRGQDRLARSSVVVVGAGGVKSSLLFTLVAAGVGRVRIIDFDRVELSNLNRQILYNNSDIGEYKSIAAARKLIDINPEINIEPIVDRLDNSNFDFLLEGFSLIFEGGESADDRRQFNRKCLEHGWPYVHASAQYNYSYIFPVVPKVSGCFECMFDDLPVAEAGPVPVLGTATLMAGSLAASESIAYLVRGTFPSAGKLVLHDNWINRAILLDASQRQGCLACNCGPTPEDHDFQKNGEA